MPDMKMKRIAKLLATFALSMCVLNCMALTPITYSKGISVRFDEGKFQLSSHEQARLIKLIEHRDDFATVNVFLVIAHGDEASNDGNRDFQAMLAGARANSINSFYAEHSSLQFHELIHTFVEPIRNESHTDEAGRAW